MTRHRVLFVLPTFPPAIGGAERHAERLTRRLAGRGHRVRVITQRQAGDVSRPAVPVRYFGATRLSAGVRNRLFALFAARALVGHAREYEVAHFILPGTHVLLGVPLAKLLGKRTLLQLGGDGEAARLAQTWHGKLQLGALRRFADRIIILNPRMREELRGLGFDDRRLVWQPSEIDTETFRPAADRRSVRARLGLAAREKIVIYVGRFVAVKRIDALVDGFAAARVPGSRLVLVGDGPLADEARARAKARGIRATFTGPLSTAELLPWLQAADVHALVSEREGISIALLEAMAVGLPTLVSDIPAMRQLVDEGVHGTLVPPGDVAAIGRGLARLLDDARARRVMGARGRARVVAEYTAARVAESHERLYEEIARK